MQRRKIQVGVRISISWYRSVLFTHFIILTNFILHSVSFHVLYNRINIKLGVNRQVQIQIETYLELSNYQLIEINAQVGSEHVNITSGTLVRQKQT